MEFILGVIKFVAVIEFIILGIIIDIGGYQAIPEAILAERTGPIQVLFAMDSRDFARSL